jgi:hypothetical protein
VMFAVVADVPLPNVSVPLVLLGASTRRSR